MIPPQQDARKALIKKLRHCAQWGMGGRAPDLLREAADALEALSESSASSETRMFPIQNGPDIPWSIIAPFEKQAQRQHDQTLEQLALRGGLSVCEVISILEGDGDYFGYWSNRSRKNDAANVLKLQGIMKERSASSETQEERSDVESARRVVTEALSVYEFHSEFEAALRTLIAQPSPAQPAETPANLAETLESALTLGVQYGVVEAQHDGALKTRAWIVEQAQRMAAETPEERKDVAPEMPGVPPVNLMAALRQALNNAYAKPAAPRSTREEEGR
jgi:hypothetical protein